MAQHHCGGKPWAQSTSISVFLCMMLPVLSITMPDSIWCGCRPPKDATSRGSVSGRPSPKLPAGASSPRRHAFPRRATHGGRFQQFRRAPPPGDLPASEPSTLPHACSSTACVPSLQSLFTRSNVFFHSNLCLLSDPLVPHQQPSRRQGFCWASDASEACHLILVLEPPDGQSVGSMAPPAFSVISGRLQAASFQAGRPLSTDQLTSISCKPCLPLPACYSVV